MQDLENAWNKIVSNCVGPVINALYSAEVKRMLLLFRVEVVRGSPKVVVWMVGLKSSEFERVNTCIGWQRPGKPSACIAVLDAITVWGATNG